MKKKRAFRQPFNILFVLSMVFSIMLSFSIPCFASSQIPLSQVLESSTSIKRYCSPISFTGTFILGTSVTLADLTVGFNDDIAPATNKDFSTLYRSVRLDQFNFFGFCPYDFESTDDTSFVLQSDVHYMVSFDLEFGTPSDVNPNPDNVYFALYAYDDSTSGKGTQVFGSIFKSSSVSPITDTRMRYSFDFAFTEEFISRHTILSFGVVLSDLSTSVSERSVRSFIYNWDFKVLDDSQYLIYRLKNPDANMSAKVEENQMLQDAEEKALNDLYGGINSDLKSSGDFSVSRFTDINKRISKSGNFGKNFLQNIFAINDSYTVWGFGILLCLTLGMFRFFFM